MVMSLEDLRAEVEAEEAEANAQTGENAADKDKLDVSPQDTDDKLDADAANETLTETGDDADRKPSDEKARKAEDWMEGDDHAPIAGKSFSNSDMAGLRQKLQAKSERKLEDKDSEIEKLILENEALKLNRPAAEKLTKPKREDFYDSDDQDEAFTDALVDYKISKSKAERVAETATTDAETRSIKRQRIISQGEDAHYERASELVIKSNISAEKYKDADLAFRQAINEVVPGGGDTITAGLVNALGYGSEKVVFNIGINQKRLDKIQELLIDDPSGLSLMSHLSDKKNSLSISKNKTSAPEPAPDINGDIVDSAGEKVMIKQFQAAESSGDQQKMMDIMSSARHKGYKTKTW